MFPSLRSQCQFKSSSTHCCFCSFQVADDRTDDSGIEDNDDAVVAQLGWDEDPVVVGRQLARAHPILNQNNEDIIGPNIVSFSLSQSSIMHFDSAVTIFKIYQYFTMVVIVLGSK